jgi:autotransporter translocation and assembly factor TamB
MSPNFEPQSVRPGPTELETSLDGGDMYQTSKIAVTLAALLIAISVFAQQHTLSGQWQATLKKGDSTGTATLNLTLSGTQVTGTVSDPSGQIWKIENGNFEDNQVTFDVTAREHGGTKNINIHFFGRVSGDLITLHNESRGQQGQTMSFHRIKE